MSCQNKQPFYPAKSHNFHLARVQTSACKISLVYQKKQTKKKKQETFLFHTEAFIIFSHGVIGQYVLPGGWV